jgi:hypothetical protein
MRPGIDEGVEPDLDALVAELFFDFRLIDLVGADVVDDLDPLPLLHVVEDDLADDPVLEADVRTSMLRSSRKLVAQSRLKSATMPARSRRCRAPRRSRWAAAPVDVSM